MLSLNAVLKQQVSIFWVIKSTVNDSTSSWIFAFGVSAPTLAVEDSSPFCRSAEDGSYVDGVGKIFVAFSEPIGGNAWGAYISHLSHY